jgi:DNA-directed RNA polymerase alpha subunit
MYLHYDVLDELAVRFIEASLIKKSRYKSEEELVNRSYRLAEILLKRRNKIAFELKKVEDEMRRLQYVKQDALDSRLISKTLGLPSRILEILASKEITTIGRLTNKTEKELRRFPNLGKAGVKQIECNLKRIGLLLKPEEERFVQNHIPPTYLGTLNTRSNENEDHLQLEGR